MKEKDFSGFEEKIGIEFKDKEKIT